MVIKHLLSGMILHPTFAALLGVAGDADGGATVGHAELEVGDGTGLVFACRTKSSKSR